MDVFDAIESRCSVREFSEKPIKKELIERMLDCARSAPSARAEEPWEFIAITDNVSLKRIADITDHGKFIGGASCAIAVICRDTKYYLEDGCAATENILISAAGLGIGSCWVAGDKKHYCQDILEYLNVRPGYKLVSIIALGYPKGQPKSAKKRSLGEVLHWERF